MNILKYIFYKDEEGIKTYAAFNGGSFDLLLYKGDEYYRSHDYAAFTKWFFGEVSLTDEDTIDYCYLSCDENFKPYVEADNEALLRSESTWSKELIENFCKDKLANKNFKVVLDAKRSFVHQTSNLSNPSLIPALYVKGVPSISWEEEDFSEGMDEEVSPLNKYFKKDYERIIKGN